MRSDVILSARIDSAELYDRAKSRPNNQLSKTIIDSKNKTKKGLHQHLIYQSKLEVQNQEFLYEKIKQLVSLNAIYSDMQMDLSVEALCLRIHDHLKQAMQFVELALPIIEIDGKTYALKKIDTTPTNGLSANIFVNENQRGSIKVFYREEKPFLLPDEQDFINIIADELGSWLTHQRDAILREQLLQDVNIIEHALDAHAIIAITNKQGKITHVNNKFCHVSKYSREELLGKDHRIINSGHHSKAFMKNLWKTIVSGSIWKNKIKNLAKDGSFYWVDTTIVPFLDENGKVYQYVAIRTEITEHILLENKMKENISEHKQLVNNLHDLTAHLQNIREDERARIAREIHDVLGATLTVLKMDLEWLSKKVVENPMHERIISLHELAGEAIETTRRVSLNLRPNVLDNLGLFGAIEWLIREFEQRLDINCQLQTNMISHNRINKKSETTIFRIVQEVFTNITRHAKATEVVVNIAEIDNELLIEISDNGIGITEQQLFNPKSFGIIGMYERTEQLGGKLRIQGGPAKGSMIELQIPLLQNHLIDESKS